MGNTVGKKIEDMTPEELEVMQNVILQTYEATKRVLESIMEALIRADLIDEDGNLTERAKELLEEARNENNT
jgi:hypothetical protein